MARSSNGVSFAGGLTYTGTVAASSGNLRGVEQARLPELARCNRRLND